jgi:hypothetical protein
MKYKIFLCIALIGITPVTMHAMVASSGGAPDVSATVGPAPGRILSPQEKAALVGVLLSPTIIVITGLVTGKVLWEIVKKAR